MLVQPILVQVTPRVHLHPDLLAVAAGLDIQTAVASLYRQRGAAVDRVGLLPIVSRYLGQSRRCKEKCGCSGKGAASKTGGWEGHGLFSWPRVRRQGRA